MVHNPIYDGPVYDSVQPHLSSLTSQVTATVNATAAVVDRKYHGLELTTSDSLNHNISGKYRYMTQPGQSGSLNGQLLQHDGDCLTCATTTAEEKHCTIQQSRLV